MACLGSKAGVIMLVLTEAGRQPSLAARGVLLSALLQGQFGQ